MNCKSILVRSGYKLHNLAMMSTTISISTLIISCNAYAGDVQTLEQQIQRIDAKNRAEIKALQNEIKWLREARGGKVIKGAPLVADEPKILMKKDPYHFGFSDASGDNTVELTGRLHIDTGGYVGYKRQSASTLPSNLADGINFRRARIGVQGVFMRDWAYGLIYDLGNSSDGYTSSGVSGLPGGGTSGIQTAILTYNGLYSHGQKFPVAFDIGARDVPFTLDQPMGSNDIMFMERSSAQVVATAFGGGDFRTQLGARSNDERYFLSAYMTGPTTGQVHTAATTGLGPQFAFVGRATYNIYQDKATNATIHVGFNYANLFAPRSLASGTTVNTSAVSLSDRPELRIDPTSILATGNIPASGGQVFGAEAAASYGNFFAQAEYYHYLVDTRVGLTDATYLTHGQNGPTASFDGGYIQASYTFGGRRTYRPSSGAYTGVLPDQPLAWGTDGWGAVEVAGRYSVVDLRSNTLGTLANAGLIGFTGLSAAKQESYSAGINWYPNGNLKFMLDYEHVVIDKNLYTSPNVKTGATIDWVGARSQFTF